MYVCAVFTSTKEVLCESVLCSISECENMHCFVSPKVANVKRFKIKFKLDIKTTDMQPSRTTTMHSCLLVSAMALVECESV